MARRRAFRRPELLEPRSMLSATVFEHDDIGYFLDRAQPAIQRYDITNEKWLSPISLAGAPSTPSVGEIDGDGIFVAYGKQVYRYNLDGSGPTHLLNTNYNVIAIHTDGNLLFLNQSNGLYARFISINKTTNQIIDTIENYVDSVYGSSIAPQVNRIVGRSQGISPSDITFVSYDDSGQFTGGGDSPYHGDYPGASSTWVFPGDAKVVDSSGTVYATDNLTRLNSLGTSVTDIGFLGSDIPIVLSGNIITAYSSSLLPTGSTNLSSQASNIFVNDTNAIAFISDTTSATGFRSQIVALADLHAPTPGQPVNPIGVPFTPDKIAVASDGNLLLYSKAQQSIFRWDLVKQTYGATIPLIGVADFMAYSSATNTIYLAYHSGIIRKIDLNAAQPVEVPFATLPQNPIGLATAGKYLFAVDPSGAWVSHYTFNPDGTLISAVEWNYYSTEYIWSDANQKMYFFRDDTSPNDLLSEEINASGTTYPGVPAGGLGLKIDSPLHTSDGFAHPIRVSPNGSIVVLGSGLIHDGATLARKAQALGNSVSDVAWQGNQLYSIRDLGGGMSQIQAWSTSTYAQIGAAQLSGRPHALLAIDGGRLLAVTIDATGIPRYTELDGSLAVVPPPVPVAKAGVDVTILTGSNVALDGSPSFDPDNAPAPLTYQWSLVSGPGQVSIGNPTSAKANFSAMAPGAYVVQLTVSDSVYTNSDTLTVTVRDDANAPIADASKSDTSAIIGRAPVKLDGSKSFDADGDPLSYEWSIVAAPNGSHATISSANQAIAGLATDVPGSYTVQLVVNDGLLNGSTTATIIARANQAPIADASRTIKMATLGGQPVKLDGSRSSDPDNDLLTYLWKIIGKPSGSQPGLQNSTSAVANLVPDKEGVYTAELTVSDGLVSKKTTVEIVIIANRAPLADASLSDLQVLQGKLPTLNGMRSSDPDAEPLSYAWQVLTSTNGAIPAIGNANQSVATLNAVIPGYYAIALTVSDGVRSDVDYIIVGVLPNHAPLADASLSATAGSVWNMVALDGSKSSDSDGQFLTYSWNVVASSRAGNTNILHANQDKARFETDTDGIYTVALTVSDGAKSDTTYVTITISPTAAAPLKGDFNQDRSISLADLPAMMNALGDMSAYGSQANLSVAGCLAVGDLNGDAKVSNGDLGGLLHLLTASAAAGAGSQSTTVSSATSYSADPPQATPMNVVAGNSSVRNVTVNSALRVLAPAQLPISSELVDRTVANHRRSIGVKLQTGNPSIVQAVRSRFEGPIIPVTLVPHFNRHDLDSERVRLAIGELSEDTVDECFSE